MGVRIPRITLNADFGDESAFGELSLISVGYGLHQAWMFATMFATTTVFGATRLFEGLYGSSISLAFFVSTIVYAVCLIFMGLTNQRFLPTYTSHKMLAFGGVCACIGTLLLLFPSSAGMPALEIASGILTGIGSSTLIIYWGTAFARCESASIVINTAIAIFVSIALFTVILHLGLGSGIISGIITTAIPLVEVAILWNKTPKSFYHRSEIPIFKPLPINRGKFLLRFTAPVFVLGLPLGMLRSYSLQNVMMNPSVNSQIVLALAGGIAMVLILITIMAIGGGDKWSRFFQPLVPLIAVTVFFIPLSGGDSMLANAFLLVGFLCFEALMWIFFGDMSQRFRLSPIFIFGVGRGTMAIAVLLGALIPVFAMNSVQNFAFGEQTVVVAMLVLMMIAYALLPREREMESIIVPCPLVKAVSTSFERQAEAAKVAAVRNCGPAPKLEATVAKSAGYSLDAPGGTGDAGAAGGGAAGGAGVADATTAGGAGAAGDAGATMPHQDAFNATMQASAGAAEGTGTAVATTATGVAATADAATTTGTADVSANVSAAQSQIASAANAAPQQAAEQTPAAWQSTAPQPATPQPAILQEQAAPQPAVPQPAAAPSEARLAMERNTASAASPANPAGEGGDANEQFRGGGRFRRKCEAVANTYLLSRRETEILFFLAKGHNSAYIQEKLYISEGTAKTHIRHIYRKLDVHSQQDLMRTVEEAEPVA